VKPTYTAGHSRRRTKRITRELDVSHWPKPHTCERCGLESAYTLQSGVTWCTSSTCDPTGATWRALDRYYRDHPEPACTA